jgi:hypothetical protein
MRGTVFVRAILVVALAFAFSQTNAPSAAQDSKGQTAKPGKHERDTITGCLTKTKSNQYRLVDQKRTTNIVYSKTVHLDSYVGQSVTVVGEQSETPSTDEGTARPMPVFWALEVQPASGNCK